MFAELEEGIISSTAQDVVMLHVFIILVQCISCHFVLLNRFDLSLNLFGLCIPLHVISIMPCLVQWGYTDLVFQ